MNLAELLAWNLAASILVMVIAWGVHLRTDKASVVDSFWGPGFVVIAWLSFAASHGPLAQSLIIALLVTVWGVRLAFHLTRRNMGKPEDPRYADMRAAHPDSFRIRSLLTVFLLQAAVMWVISLPVQVGMRGLAAMGLGFLDGLGILLWCAGFFFEAVGDEQLYRFKADPANKGKILDKGLWRYTRHPNYFGETVMWWGIFLVACTSPSGWWTFIGPLLLTLLLLKVSGVSLTERKMGQSHSELDEYKRRVSAFIPRPPREPGTTSFGIRLAESGRVPDRLLRGIIRLRHRAVLKREDPGGTEARQESLRAFLRDMETRPIAPAPLEANRQHYEVSAAFFENILGPWLKYSACLWPEEQLGRHPQSVEAASERELLAEAEEAMLRLTAERARIEDGMRILDLGCGWGAFSLWAAERFPGARITAVSHSARQGAFIRDRAAARNLDNVRAVTADMNRFEPPEGRAPFDRILSVEMFEHMANWPELLQRVSGWLKEEGLFFLHVFAHRELAYPFRQGPGDWMGKHFFSGGIMPSDDLLLHLQRDLVLRDHWRVNGRHYARTIDSWLSQLDASRDTILEILSRAHGPEQGALQLNRWRMFFLACSELFAYRKGNEWLLSHYLMARRRTP
jgi:cyclopropane-fatty-acyl-phospholipid synthase